MMADLITETETGRKGKGTGRGIIKNYGIETKKIILIIIITEKHPSLPPPQLSRYLSYPTITQKIPHYLIVPL